MPPSSGALGIAFKQCHAGGKTMQEILSAHRTNFPLGKKTSGRNIAQFVAHASGIMIGAGKQPRTSSIAGK